MGRTFLVKDVALQAGVSLATADRVLNGRGGVRAQTTQRVQEALAELDRQNRHSALLGRKFLVDVVMEAPNRFTDAVRAAAELEIASLRPAAFRFRFHLVETPRLEELAGILTRIARRGTHGVILKAPDMPGIGACVAALASAGIPTVTLVTDLPNTRRLAYVGMDNRAAGETAAYLLGAWLRDAPATVLVTLSSSRFRGEEEREIGFRRGIRARAPHLQVREISEGRGIDRETGELVRAALAADGGISAVYSIGGGNEAILGAFAQAGRRCEMFIGHDLDHDNLRLLRAGRISAILHHDLRQDLRVACQHIMRAHGALPAAAVGEHFNAASLSPVQIVTPFNLPSGL
jgi:LacI family transcriptional regulator, galactose operon repressor